MKGYTTITKVENYMNEDIPAGKHAVVEQHIGAIEAYIDSYTDRDFSPKIETPVFETRRFSGDGSRELFIDPAIEIEWVKLHVDDSAVDEDDYVVYPIDGDTLNRIVLLYQDFPEGVANIYISAKWGYEQVPQDIELVATALVAGLSGNLVEVSADRVVNSITVGRYSLTYANAETAEQTNSLNLTGILDRHRKISF